MHFLSSVPVVVQTAFLLVLSNCFMTFAWYGHLKNLAGSPWYVAAVVSWSIALFEYLLQVPANRIGFTELSLAQLKILQEVITLSVFVPFAVLYMKQPLKLDYLWAALCILFFVLPKILAEKISIIPLSRESPGGGMVDAEDSKSSALKSVRVRVSPRAP